jgi:hypothetical protein
MPSLPKPFARHLRQFHSELVLLSLVIAFLVVSLMAFLLR